MEITNRRRPLGIVLLALVFAVLAVFPLIAAFTIPGAFRELAPKLEQCLEKVGLKGMGFPSPLGMWARGVAVSGVLVALAIGLARLRQWAWWFAIFLEGLNLLDLITGSTPLIALKPSGFFGTLLIMLLHVAILMYLTRQRDLFLRPSSEPEILTP